MMNAANLDGIGVGRDKEEPVVADAQTKFISPLECFHIAHTRLRKAMQRRKNVHGVELAQFADIGLGGISPNDSLHFCT